MRRSKTFEYYILLKCIIPCLLISLIVKIKTREEFNMQGTTIKSLFGLILVVIDLNVTKSPFSKFKALNQNWFSLFSNYF